MVDTYRNILVAIDGSEKAEKAFLEAITIAKRNQQRCTSCMSMK